MPCVLPWARGRRRIFRQVLVESVVLSLVGGAFGMVPASSTVNVLKVIGGHTVPCPDSVQVGWPVFAFGFAAFPHGGSHRRGLAACAARFQPGAVSNAQGRVAAVGGPSAVCWAAW